MLNSGKSAAYLKIAEYYTSYPECTAARGVSIVNSDDGEYPVEWLAKFNVEFVDSENGCTVSLLAIDSERKDADMPADVRKALLALHAGMKAAGVSVAHNIACAR